jgi:hypothetical protein
MFPGMHRNGMQPESGPWNKNVYYVIIIIINYSYNTAVVPLVRYLSRLSLAKIT